MYNVQDYSFLYNKVIHPIIYEGWHFAHLHDHIISLRKGVWAHKTSQTPSLFIESSCTKPGKWAVISDYNIGQILKLVHKKNCKNIGMYHRHRPLTADCSWY